MQDVQNVRPHCCQTGMLVMNGGCYALHSEAGDEYWLEMDRIPHHLVDKRVRIEGTMYGTSLISVEGIGPI